MRLREADCRRGRTRFEGGRYRRDGSPATESVRTTRRGDMTMRMSDDPALRDYDDYYIGSILRGEGTAFLLDQGNLFAAYDALGHDILEKAISRTRQIDHWLASNFDGAIIFDEGDAVQHAAGEESECRAHDNLKAVPQTASVASKAAA
jgi:P-loop containing NTP hydrolase pore-1